LAGERERERKRERERGACCPAVCLSVWTSSFVDCSVLVRKISSAYLKRKGEREFESSRERQTEREFE
jgi:hypothetical protein